MRPLRIAIAVVAALVAGWLSWQLARADTDIGAPFGAERRIEALAHDSGELPPDSATQARLALRDRPIDGRAYRVLAQVAQSSGGDAEANDLFTIAAQRWPRDRIAQATLADAAFARGDYSTALTHLDALLRVARHVRQPALAALLPHVGDAALRTGLVDRLAQDPPWRSSIVAPLLADSTPPPAALALLEDLAARGPLTERELQARITILDRTGRAAEARTAWLQTLTPGQRTAAGLVFDGGFEHPEVSGGYGWHTSPVPGVAIGPDPTDPHAGDLAMALLFDGRAVRFHHLGQPLALSPGRYVLRAATNNRVRSDRPFLWRITCTDGGAKLIDLTLPGTTGWSTGQGEFEVATGCNRQQLQLHHSGRSLSERSLRGTLLLDGITITEAA